MKNIPKYYENDRYASTNKYEMDNDDNCKNKHRKIIYFYYLHN